MMSYFDCIGMKKEVSIGDSIIGAGHPVFIIAEAGVNHNGDVELAKRMIVKAKDSGADAIKFQTYSTETVIATDAPKAQYQLETTDGSESQYEMLERLRLTHEEFDILNSYAKEVGIAFFSTPSDKLDVDFLLDISVPALKIASMDVVNIPFLEYVGRKRVPVILSTGMATLGEVEAGLSALKNAGCSDILLLHCVTSYPAEEKDSNLRVMNTLRQAFQIPVGLSDHSQGIIVPIAAVALGAVVVEKHFTLDTCMSGPDHSASLNPDSFKDMVKGIRTVESALGSSVKKPLPVEIQNRLTMRRSLVAAVDLKAGIVLKREHLLLKRPGDGLGSEFIQFLVGRRLRKFIPQGCKLTLDDIGSTGIE